MADDKDENQSPKPDEDKAPPAAQQGGAPSGGNIDSEVEQALGRLVEKGTIFGGSAPASTSSEAPSGQPSSPPGGQGFDLEGAISRVLDRRESERKTTDERQQLLDKVDRLEKAATGVKKRWWDPWSPWS